ncbi:MAG: hypothetical protein Q9165_002701 [Trypethelium subeluteriae]
MSAENLSITTRVIVDPHLDDDNVNGQRVNSTLSYGNSLSGNIRTLSPGEQSSEDVGGFLYVPDLTGSNAACQNASITATGVNTTDFGGIQSSYNFVAIAPWLSPQCVLAYMAQAEADGALAFIFYLPNDDMFIPPPANDDAWVLGDGGQWKSLDHYPVYAIPGEQGMNAVAALSTYSGRNISAVPNGAMLSKIYDQNALVRLYVDIGVGDAPTLPSLWNFLLIVLGILLFFVGIVSLTMHWFQRRRRANLQRRIANGEVDLAELGIVKRLTVPREMLDKLPLQVYNSSDRVASSALRPDNGSRTFITDLDSAQDDLEKKSLEISTLPRRNSDITDLQASTASLSTLPPTYTTSNANPTTTSLGDAANIPLPHSPSSPITVNLSRFAQPTCAICLDDFIPSQTTIRILPCDHIFHPACVDDFLLQTSSLCPMCKTSVLPKGYCPTKVTNAMVRRERRLQIVREARAARRRRQEAAFGSPHHPLSPAALARPHPVPGARAWRRERVPAEPVVAVPAPSIRLFRTPRLAAGRRVSSAPTPSTLEARRARMEALAAEEDGVEERGLGGVSLAPVPDAAMGDLPAAGLPRSESFAQAQGRREWARQRALALMGHRGSVGEPGDAETVMGTVTEVEREEHRDRPGRIRRAFAVVFPGFR